MNDPRITSYALGELTGAERDAFERELAASETLQRELNEIVHLAEVLGKLPMPTETFSEQERSTLREKCAENLKTQPRKSSIPRTLIAVGTLAAAACFVFISLRLSAPEISGRSGGEAANLADRDQDVRSIASSRQPAVASADTALAAAEKQQPSETTDLTIASAPPSLPRSEADQVKTDSSRPALAGTPDGADKNVAHNEAHAMLLSRVQSALETSQLADAGAREGELVESGGLSRLERQDSPKDFLGSEQSKFASGQVASESGEYGVVTTGNASLVGQSGARTAGGLDDYRKNNDAKAPVMASIEPQASPMSAPASAIKSEGFGRTIAEAKPVADQAGVRTAGRRFANMEEYRSADLAPQSDRQMAGAQLWSGPAASSLQAERFGDMRTRPSAFANETYDTIQENVFLEAKENPLSTFSIDVDTASYANVRRFLQDDQIPPAGAIRTEELINYFSYAYPQPEGGGPFSVNLEVSRAPWDSKRELVRVGLKGREIPASERGPANLVFLLDVSGSMDQPDKLPLLQRSLKSLVENLSPKDRVAIVVYAGSSGLVLPSTPGTEKSRIIEAIGNLKAGGSTNGGEGIRLAYDIARENFLKEGNNRVILCTDGDFNVGTTSQGELVRLIEKERASGVFLSVLGFGTGNLKDSTMEKLADTGNGNYAYIDSLTEGRKVLVEQMSATLFTIAKDVKIQVEFNPARVAGYRLIGYENRLLAKEDFNNDKKDAGEIGAGHSVTALYEIIPAGEPLPDRPSVDPLKYQSVEGENPKSEELLTVKLRYKAPDGDKSKLLEVPFAAPEIPAFDQASADFRFAAAVAAFGMKLRGSPAAGDIGWNDLQKIVRATLGDDPGSYRAEFLTLIEKAARLSPSGRTPEE